MAKAASKRTEGRLMVYAGPELKRAIERAARERGISASTLVTLALRDYLKREGRAKP